MSATGSDSLDVGRSWTSLPPLWASRQVPGGDGRPVNDRVGPSD